MSTLKTATDTTWLAAAFLENPEQVFSVDPFDETILLADPANNSRGYTPEIGSKELSEMIENMDIYGQTTPGFATLLDDGRASLYAGFQRLRSRQTMEKERLAAGGAPGDESAILFRLLITPEQLTEQQMFQRSLSENVFRTEMTIMQRVAALKRLTTDPSEGGSGLTLTQAAKTMNMDKASASVYWRFDLFPAITKRAINQKKVGYRGAEGWVALLPSRKDMAEEPEETKGQLLAAAQEKIAKQTEKLLAKGKGKVTGADVDKATRKTAGKDGKAANTRQRKPKAICDEIDEFITASEAAEVNAKMAAFKKFVNGSTIKALAKALAG